MNAGTVVPVSTGTMKYAQKMIITSGMPRNTMTQALAAQRTGSKVLRRASPRTTAIGKEKPRPRPARIKVAAKPPIGPLGQEPIRNMVPY